MVYAHSAFSASRACSPPPRLPPRHLVRQPPPPRQVSGQRAHAGDALLATARAARREPAVCMDNQSSESRPKRRRARARPRRRLPANSRSSSTSSTRSMRSGVERRLGAPRAHLAVDDEGADPKTLRRREEDLRLRDRAGRTSSVRWTGSVEVKRSRARGIELRQAPQAARTLRGSPAGSSGSSGSSRGVSVGVTIAVRSSSEGEGVPPANGGSAQGFRPNRVGIGVDARVSRERGVHRRRRRAHGGVRARRRVGSTFSFLRLFPCLFGGFAFAESFESARSSAGPLAVALVVTRGDATVRGARTDRGGAGRRPPRAVPRVSPPRRVPRARRRRRRRRRPAPSPPPRPATRGARAHAATAARRRARRRRRRAPSSRRWSPGGSRLRRARARTRRLFFVAAAKPRRGLRKRPQTPRAHRRGAVRGHVVVQAHERARVAAASETPRGGDSVSGTPRAWRTVRAWGSHAARSDRASDPSPRTRRSRTRRRRPARVGSRSTRSRSSGAEERREAPNAAGPGTAPGDAGGPSRAARRRRPPPPPPRPPRAQPRRRLPETKPPQPRARLREPPPEPRGLPGPLRRARGPPPAPNPAAAAAAARVRDAFVGLLRVAPRWSSPPLRLRSARPRKRRPLALRRGPSLPFDRLGIVRAVPGARVRVLVCPCARVPAPQNRAHLVHDGARHRGHAPQLGGGSGPLAASGASVVFSVFSIFSVRLYASTVASALSSFAVSTRSSAFRVSSAFLAASRERSHASSRERVVQLALQPLFALRVLHHLLDELRHLALVLRREVVQRAARDERGGGRGRRGVGGNRPVLRAERRERGVDVPRRDPEDAATRARGPRRRTRGRGGASASAGAGAGAGAGGRERLILGLCAIADAAGGERGFGLAFWVAATRERTCAYGSFSLARAVAAPRTRAVRRRLDRASAERGRGAPRLLRRRDGRAGVRFRPRARGHRDRGSGAVARRARLRGGGGSRAPPRHLFLPPLGNHETLVVRAQTVGIDTEHGLGQLEAFFDFWFISMMENEKTSIVASDRAPRLT